MASAPRKRKAPEKKPVRRPQGLVVRGTLAAGHLVAANPSFFGGLVAFGVIFSFVAANALWYQPRSHPHPLLNTRDAFQGFEQKQGMADDPSGVTTFKIERQGQDIDNAPAIGSTDVAAEQVIAPSGPKAASFPDTPPSSEVVLQIQQQLANLGFYDGPVDGQPGIKTSTAIQFYQDKNGMAINGQPSLDLLNALRASNGMAAIVPLDRPSGDLTTNSTQVDPVAAAIAEADAPQPIVPAMIPPAAIPDAKAAAKAVSVPKAQVAKAQTQKTTTLQKPLAPAQKLATKPATKPVAKATELASNTSKGLDIASIIASDARPAKPAAKANAAPSQSTKVTPAKAPAGQAAKTIPATARPQQSASAGSKASPTVLRIQKALTRFYSNIPQNGVAGPETRAAIRNFEKNYGLPVTGEPSDTVLKKMKDVGVL